MLKTLNSYPGDREFEIMFQDIDADGKYNTYFNQIQEKIDQNRVNERETSITCIHA